MSRQMIKPLPKSLAKLRLSVAAESNFSTGHSLQSWLDFANLSDLSVPLESLTNGLTTSAEVLPSGAFIPPPVEVNNVSVSQVSQVSMLDLRDETLISGSNQQPTPTVVAPVAPVAPVTVDPGQPKPCCYSGIRCQKTSKTYSTLFEVVFFFIFLKEKSQSLKFNTCSIQH